MRDSMVSLAWRRNVIESYVGVNPVHLSLPQSCILKSNVSVNEIKYMPVPLWKVAASLWSLNTRIAFFPHKFWPNSNLGNYILLP